MRRRPVAAILTLGCKLNLADSEAIARGLRGAGYDVVDRVCEADAFVVNTCSVTHVADQKSRRLIRSVRRLAPDAAVTVTGCYPQSAGFDAAAALGADLVVGTKERDRAALVRFLLDRSENDRLGATILPHRDIPPHPPTPSYAPPGVVAAAAGEGETLPAVETPSPLLRKTGLHTGAFIKAQEGCNDVCSFCIVPQTRGREDSHGIAEVVRDVQAAVDDGAREVVITGTQLGAWGRDLDPKLQPHDLIAGILEGTDVLRLRFSSLQPQDITPELLALWQDPRLMPHFHLALQSGSESVLAAMRRRYTAREFVAAAARINAAVPGAAITTDVIAGFPGETDADFADTVALCRGVGFARLHCFPYSQRARTTANRMPDQVAHAVKQQRIATLTALSDELGTAFRARFAGAIRPVLWEEQRTIDGEQYWRGHTDNYIDVFARGAGPSLKNRVTAVRLATALAGGMLAEEPGL